MTTHARSSYAISHYSSCVDHSWPSISVTCCMNIFSVIISPASLVTWLGTNTTTKSNLCWECDIMWWTAINFQNRENEQIMTKNRFIHQRHHISYHSCNEDFLSTVSDTTFVNKINRYMCHSYFIFDWLWIPITSCSSWFVTQSTDAANEGPWSVLKFRIKYNTTEEIRNVTEKSNYRQSL